MQPTTMLSRAIEKLREKSGSWKKMVAVTAGVNPSKVDELIAQRDEKIIAVIYQMAGMGGKMLLADTNVKRMIHAAIEGAAKSKRLYFLAGPTGCGKTYTASSIIEELHERYSVGYLRISELNCRSQNVLMTAIGDAFPTLDLGQQWTGLGYGRYRKILDQFNRNHGCLVIDEAQKLTMKSLETMRDLFDETDLSFVFMASVQFYERMNISRLDTTPFGQFIRRSDDKYRLIHATPKDVSAFVSLYGIALEMREAKRIAGLIEKHGDIDTLSRAFRKIASLHDDGELEWKKVGAGDIEEAITRVISIQKVDNLIESEAA